MAIPLGLIAAGIPSVLKGLGGLLGIGQGKARARRNTRPIENVNPLIAQNNAIAENDALVGLPQQQYNLINQGIQRNQAGAYRQLGRSANPSAGLASLVRGGNDAILNLGAQDANARMQNRRFAFGTRSALANEQNRVFDWNQRRKYLEEGQAASQQINSGKQNAFGGLTDLSQLAQSYFSDDSNTSSNNGGNDWKSGYGKINSWGRRGV